MQELDKYIDKVKSLPTAPRILPELLQLLRKENVDSDKVVRLISLDPALTASVLRLCNSAYYGGATPAANLQDAVTRLGFQQIYQLVAAVAGSKALSPAQSGYGLDAGELWKHCVTSAVTAQLIARKVGDDPHLAFTAALLHDIGKIVLSDALAAAYNKLMEEAKKTECSVVDLEKKVLGVQHAEIGGRLLQRWKFPENLVNAVWFHHTPNGAKPHHRLAACVYLGNMVAYFMGHGYGFQAFAVRGRAEAFEILQLDPNSLPGLMIQTFENLQMVDALLNAGAAGQPAAAA